MSSVFASSFLLAVLDATQCSLYLIGHPLQRAIGSGNFLTLYFTSAVAANLVWYALECTGKQMSLGASGAVAAVTATGACLFPNAIMSMTLYQGVHVRIPFSLYACLYLLAEWMLWKAAAQDHIAHTTHWSGTMMGIVFALLLRRHAGHGSGIANAVNVLRSWRPYGMNGLAVLAWMVLPGLVSS